MTSTDVHQLESDAVWTNLPLMRPWGVENAPLSTAGFRTPDFRGLLRFDEPMHPFAIPSRTVQAIRSAQIARRICTVITACLMVAAFTITEVVMPLASAAEKTAPGVTWASPVPAMEILEAFDPPKEAWLAGHRGIDVHAMSGEPLHAPAAGTLRFRGSVAGAETVSIETDSGYIVSFQAATSDLKKGDEFAAGEEIGEVGDGSHCDTSCLHIGVWKAGGNKVYIDPAKFFGHEQSILLPLARKPAREPAEEPGKDSTTSGAGAWGGHRNGRIPDSAMCVLGSAPGQMLRCDAQKSFDRLSHAYEARFNAPISVTDAYRDYATQVILKRRKGRMAATPGTSNHGWALAVDLGGGINSFGSAEHQWMRANAPKFGWIHPGWARQGGSLPEPWHWEFRK